MYENFWSAMYFTFTQLSKSAPLKQKIDDTILPRMGGQGSGRRVPFLIAK